MSEEVFSDKGKNHKSFGRRSIVEGDIKHSTSPESWPYLSNRVGSMGKIPDIRRVEFSTILTRLVHMTEKTEREKHADTIVRNHIIWSMGAGLIPVPIV